MQEVPGFLIAKQVQAAKLNFSNEASSFILLREG